MKPRASAVAQKLLNLYRQEHVIFGGWAAVNQVFVAEADADVISALREMPTGRALVRHIENLRNGSTPMDTIERDLMPYGGMMADTTATIPLTAAQWQTLQTAINNFIPTQEGLDQLQQLDVVKKFGDQWLVGIRAALAARPDLLDKWDIVTKTQRAYHLWQIASEIVEQPLTERARAQLQADMPEYETYLPMFGNAGTELLVKLRQFISTIKQPDDIISAA